MNASALSHKNDPARVALLQKFVTENSAYQKDKLLPVITAIVQLPKEGGQLAYPGDVPWNEDGMRFAWHVLIREKHGKVTFVAVFADGKRLEVPSHHYLTARQIARCRASPI